LEKVAGDVTNDILATRQPETVAAASLDPPPP
jgi:hypothetical protein